MTDDLRPYFIPPADTQFNITVVDGNNVSITSYGTLVGSHVYKFYTPNIIAPSDIVMSDVVVPEGTEVSWAAVTAATGSEQLIGWNLRLIYNPQDIEGTTTCILRIRDEVYYVRRVFVKTG